MSSQDVVIDIENAKTATENYSNNLENHHPIESVDSTDGISDSVAPIELTQLTSEIKTLELSAGDSYAVNKNIAKGLMDIALLSANANQLRFLITYNHESPTYYISLVLVILSLVTQLVVGIAIIFLHRIQRKRKHRYVKTNELLVMGIFMVTVINILLAAFTTTNGKT